jgi:TPR repeat protein
LKLLSIFILSFLVLTNSQLAYASHPKRAGDNLNIPNQKKSKKHQEDVVMTEASPIHDWSIPANLDEIIDQANAGNLEAQETLVLKINRGLINDQYLETVNLPSWKNALDRACSNSPFAFAFFKTSKSKNIDDAVKQAILSSLQQRADQKDPESQYILAFVFDHGLAGITKDDKHLVELYHEAAHHGFARAEFYLGMMYLNGNRGLTQDDTQVVHWWKRAADQGYALAQFKLGAMYEQGRGGLTKNDVQAVQWYRKAADQNNAEAQVYLGFLYEDGRGGLTKDDVQAVQWYRQAADQGHAWAQFKLGGMYEQGRGELTKDDVQAVQWYRKAADQGVARAQYHLAAMYVTGRGGLSKDELKAIELYLKSFQKINSAQNQFRTLLALPAVPAPLSDQYKTAMKAVPQDPVQRISDFKLYINDQLNALCETLGKSGFAHAQRQTFVEHPLTTYLLKSLSEGLPLMEAILEHPTALLELPPAIESKLAAKVPGVYFDGETPNHKAFRLYPKPKPSAVMGTFYASFGDEGIELADQLHTWRTQLLNLSTEAETNLVTNSALKRDFTMKWMEATNQMRALPSQEIEGKTNLQTRLNTLDKKLKEIEENLQVPTQTIAIIKTTLSQFDECIRTTQAAKRDGMAKTYPHIANDLLGEM